MSYQVKVRHSIDEVDSSEWQSLTKGIPFSSQHWYRFASRIGNEKTVFYLLYNGERLVGAAVANLYNKLNMTLSSPLAHRLARGILSRYPLLLCQRHLANMTGLILPPNDELNALRALSDAMQADANHSSFVVLGYLTEKDYQQITPLGEFNFVQMDNSTILPITWSSFEDYARSLGKSARKDLNRHNNRARDMKITIEFTHQFTQHTDRLLELIGNVYAHHHTESENNANRRLLAEVERDLPDNSVMMLAWADGVLAGSGLLMYDEGVMGQAFLGLDYSYKNVYFQLFYEAIRYAIEHNIKVIRSGTGAYEFKRSLGFQEESAYVGIAPRGRVLRWLGNYLAKQVRSEQEQPEAQHATV